MTKYSGVIGIRGPIVEEAPAVLRQRIVEIDVVGDIIIKPTRWSDNERIQSNLSANHVIKLFASEEQAVKYSDAIYATWQGKKWKVSKYEYARPRVFLTLGEIYNG